MISKIEKKESDILKDIDEKGSQHLSRMLGVESKMNIHSFNPEILIQRLHMIQSLHYCTLIQSCNCTYQCRAENR